MLAHSVSLLNFNVHNLNGERISVKHFNVSMAVGVLVGLKAQKQVQNN